MLKKKMTFNGSDAVEEFISLLEDRTLRELEALPADKIKLLISKTKLPSLLISREFGGTGVDTKDILYVLHDVAYVFPSAALMLCMHYHVISTIAKFPFAFPFANELLNAIAKDNLLVASAFAESGSGQNIFQTSVLAKCVGDKVIVSGSKRPCTMSSVADFIAASVITEDRIPGVAIISRDRDGLSSKPFWPGDIVLGTDSNEVVFDSVELESKWTIFAEDQSFEAYLNYGLACFNLLIGAAYSGVTSRIVHKLDAGFLAKSADGVDLQGKMALCFYSLTGVSLEVKPESLEHIVPTVLSLRYQIQRILKEIKNRTTENIGSKVYLSDQELHYLLRVADLLPFHPVTRSGFDQMMGN